MRPGGASSAAPAPRLAVLVPPSRWLLRTAAGAVGRIGLSRSGRWDLRSFARGAASIPGPIPHPFAPFAPGVGVGRPARTCRAHVGKVDGKPYTPNTVHNTNGNDGRTATVMKMIVMCNRTGRILAASQGNRAPWSKLAGSQRTAMLSRGPVPGC